MQKMHFMIKKNHSQQMKSRRDYPSNKSYL